MADENDVQKIEIVSDGRSVSDAIVEENRKGFYYQTRFRKAMTVWMIGFTAVVVYMYIQNRDRSSEGQQAKQALCVFRHDLEIRANATASFLKEHPQGIQGIPVIG
jgi:pyoverdine/dityrosine biosynthesis protein Dit1